MSIRANLQIFSYDPKPEWYEPTDKSIETKSLVVLENGAEYEG